MRAEHGPRAGGYLVELLDKNRTRLPKFIHDMLVMDNLLAHVDRRPVKIQRDFHHINSAYHARAKTTRLEQIDFLLGAIVGPYGLQWHSDSFELKTLDYNSLPVVRNN